MCIQSIKAECYFDPELSGVNFQLEAASVVFVTTALVNIEAKFYSTGSENLHLFGRVGFGYAELSSFTCDRSFALGVPLGLTMLTGQWNHHFEINGGAFIGSFSARNHDSTLFGKCDYVGAKILPLFDLGYRYQDLDGGIIFRAKAGLLGVGIAVGYAF